MFYKKYVFPYEQKNYFGEQNCDVEPSMVLSFPRKLIKTESGAQGQKAKVEQVGSLLNEIGKNLEEEEQTKKLFYLKKTKLSTTKAEIRKMVLGLDVFAARKDIVYSLNMLTLFSVNSHHPFLF